MIVLCENEVLLWKRHHQTESTRLCQTRLFEFPPHQNDCVRLNNEFGVVYRKNHPTWG